MKGKDENVSVGTEEKARIEVRENKSLYGAFQYQYMAKFDEEGNLTGELHGFAIDKNNQIKLIGDNKDRLKVHLYPQKDQSSTKDASDKEGFQDFTQELKPQK